MNMFKDSGFSTPKDYIDSIDEPRKSEMKELDALIRKAAPSLKPQMLSGMLGYGKYHYKSKSREGDWCAVLLSSRKQYISLYVCVTDGKKYLAEEYQKKLPKADIGKSCIRFKTLKDIDVEILKEMLKKAAAWHKQQPQAKT